MRVVQYCRIYSIGTIREFRAAVVRETGWFGPSNTNGLIRRIRPLDTNGKIRQIYPSDTNVKIGE